MMFRHLWWMWRGVALGLRSPLKASVLALYLPAARLLGRVGLALDPWTHPALRRTPLRAPVIILGQPRSGTTFLQRFLVEHGVGCGREVWQMVYPSLTQQALLRPLLPLLEAVSPVRYHDARAHETGLREVETDDASLLFRFTDGFFLYAFFLTHLDEDLVDHFDPRHRDTLGRDLAWLGELWRRSLVASGASRVVAKSFALSSATPALLAAFPDARVIYMARDPLSTLPSGLSLVTGVLDRAFGFGRLPPERQRRATERIYAGLVTLMRRFAEDWEAGRVDRERVFVLRFDRLMNDFDGLMGELLAFLGHDPDPALVEAIRARAEAQRQHRSAHRYDLASFGLSEARVREDCAAFYRAFLTD